MEAHRRAMRIFLLMAGVVLRQCHDWATDGGHSWVRLGNSNTTRCPRGKCWEIPTKEGPFIVDILVVDDDLTTRKMLRFVLEQQGGHRVVEAADGAAAQALLAAESFDLAMIDVVMPGIDGLELCKRIRATSNMPIVVVSARGDIQSRVRGLQLGADDYLPKPFDPSELAARVDAVLRRSNRSARADGDGRMRIGDVTLDLTEHRVELRQPRGSRRNVQLTPTEFKLLLVLARDPGRAFSRQELQASIWGTSGEAADANSSTVNAYVSGLRDRLETDPKNPRYLVTVRNVGYRFDP
jgi:DNA-binding response OmpR family regulator